MALFESAPRISPFLWFDDNAAAAVDFYCSVFPDARRLGELRSPARDPLGRLAGRILTITFELAGQRFTALNGGPEFRFSPAVSFVVRCDSQQEVDEYWARLSEGGSEGRCGWLQDRFGLSWQIVPARIGELIAHHGGFAAMLTMTKLDIAALERAAGA
ncbi:MAG: VOC family protein [Terriglobales bacterium]